ncbi:OmpA family protein [Blastococcus sp. TML/M2B]|uniref:OmpA family protein n=1 Tax=unclassified Blastococcus TaxID=2619396 RepID=UPI00190E2E80|nr:MULTISPECIES: OmpA family protein [unclassified Blastococcus]MBN1091288.1 OmpA family protein [Blastococcus sp. TML/M2B]MBN1095153.1 OmpA family protein [Blastococcus sp. TML/C7B]
MRVRTPGRWGAVLVAAVVTAGLAGCGGSSVAAEPSGVLAVVVGGHAGAPAPVLTGAAAAARDLAVAQQSMLSVVVADGAPTPVGEPVRLAGGSAEQRAENRQRVDDAVSGVRAQAPESDLLTALGVAARSVPPGPGLRTLVVLDPGLSTAGPMDLTRPGLLDAEPKEVADSLADAGLLPALDGFSVVFQGLGQAVLPQAPPDEARRTQVEQLWTTIALRSGAVAVELDDVRDPAPLEGPLPAVRSVDVGPGVSCSPQQLVLRGGDVGFRPGEIEFLDRARVIEVLGPFARQMQERQIIGEVFGFHPAVGDPERVVTLSHERAQQVANVLIELGVDVDNLRVLGFGSSSEDYVPDRDAAGRLDPAAAALNRVVTIDFTADVDCG